MIIFDRKFLTFLQTSKLLLCKLDDVIKQHQQQQQQQQNDNGGDEEKTCKSG